MIFTRIKRSFYSSKKKLVDWILYAVGEILLITIGVLIALSIQNWNEQRKDKDKGAKIELDIFNDLNSDIIRLTEHMNFMKNQVETISKMLYLTKENNKEKLDSSFQIYNEKLRGFYRFTPTNLNFSTLNLKYNLSLIEDKSIIAKLSGLYHIYANYELNSVTYKESFDDFLIPKMSDYTDAYHNKIIDYKFFYSLEFRNFLSGLKFNLVHEIGEYETTLQEINDLKISIESNLPKWFNKKIKRD